MLMTDNAIREQALEVQQSFIVQAPAGSGKTELLTQRYLKLLACAVRYPEEIIAITFTRKAAHEMRERIMLALHKASLPKPDAAHEQRTWQLANAVLTANQHNQWGLLQNPSRLRLLTIDAFCAQICSQIPLLAKLGVQPEISNQPQELYRQAARQVLTQGIIHPRYQTPISTLLLHLDNHANYLEQLLADMLAKRAQWLPHIFQHQGDTHALKNDLEHALERIALDAMSSAKQLLTTEVFNELTTLARYAGQQLHDTNPTHPLTCCAELIEPPSVDIAEFDYWRGFANLLLTTSGSLRKTIDKRSGFPAPSNTDDKQLKTTYREFKNRWQMLINTFDNDSAAHQALQTLTNCPPVIYDDQQWHILQALLEVLPLLCAELQLVFQQHSAIDFVELNLAANRALGTEEQPTDLALHLDYKIQHLLIDEFQDTAVSQFELLEKLIAGWQVDDGRSIFLVGDPMQSIYRFRQAEVGLFLRAKQQGIANIPLTSLTLQQNFRSSPTLVSWTNTTCQQLFPQHADINAGAIPFVAAKASKTTAGLVNYYLLTDGDLMFEASQISQTIQSLQQQNDKQTIAILVRSRWQLLDIIPEFIKQNIAYQAVDIDTLDNCIEIQDLLTLTSALLHRADRLHWLALLRSPLCGLTLDDLHRLATAPYATLWQAIQHHDAIAGLTAHGQQTLVRISQILKQAYAEFGQLSVSAWIYRVWLGLGGPTVINAAERDNCLRYFELLNTLSSTADVNLQQLKQQLHYLFSEPTCTTDNPVQIMTIHKSKGLEFDHVLLPSLERKTPNETSQLLAWLERPTMQGYNDLVLAPIKATANDRDPIYHYVRQMEKAKLTLESARLLYVAITRAKHSIHLYANLATENNELTAPPTHSFLGQLWPTHAQAFQAQQKPASTMTKPEQTDLTSTRIRADWQLHNANNQAWQPQINNNQDQHIEPFALDNMTQRNQGTVIHETLALLTTQPLSYWSEARLHDLKNKWHKRLQQLNTPYSAIDHCIHIITQAITNTLADPNGRWILNTHPAARSEFAICCNIANKLTHLIIDRTFINQGYCWVIDYKTAIPTADKNPQEFIAEQHSLYHNQLQQYAVAMSTITDLPIKCGIYFTHLAHLHQWNYQQELIYA